MLDREIGEYRAPVYIHEQTTEVSPHTGLLTSRMDFSSDNAQFAICMNSSMTP